MVKPQQPLAFTEISDMAQEPEHRNKGYGSGRRENVGGKKMLLFSSQG